MIVGDFLREFGVVIRDVRPHLADDAPELVLHGSNYVGNSALNAGHANV